MSVLAHGVGQSTDLPLPLDLVLQAGAATVVISFLASALLWRRPRLQSPEARRPRTTWWRTPLRLVVLAVSLYVTINALVGPRTAANPAAHALFVWLWVGLIPLSVAAGPIWRVVNPLRTIHTSLQRLIPIASSRAQSPPRLETPLPPGGQPATNGIATTSPAVRTSVDRSRPNKGLTAVPPTQPSTTAMRTPTGRSSVNGSKGGHPTAGEWPAAVALLGFAWFELIAPGRTDPFVIGIALAGYAVVQIGLALRFGAGWFGRADAFEVYSDLAGRLSPFRWRPPFSGLAADRPAGIGRAAFLAVWWGSTVFDSASGSPAWAGFVQRAGHPVLLGTAGLIAVCAVVLGGVRRLSGRLDVTNSLIPIAVSYTLAHYLTLLLVEAPRGVLLASQQWGVAAGARWDPVPHAGLISVLQVLLILAGHALGVLAAHDRALADTPGRPPLATLADELPVVLFMIACTWAGLFLLFVR